MAPQSGMLMHFLNYLTKQRSVHLKTSMTEFNSNDRELVLHGSFRYHTRLNRARSVFLLEHTLFENVSNGPAFCDKRKFKRLNMALII